MPLRSSTHSTCCCWWCQNSLAYLLKFLNFLQTFVGVSIVIYSVWMLDQWNRHGRIPPAPASAPSLQDSVALHSFDSAILPSDSISIPGQSLSMRFDVDVASGFEDVIGFHFNSFLLRERIIEHVSATLLSLSVGILILSFKILAGFPSLSFNVEFLEVESSGLSPIHGRAYQMRFIYSFMGIGILLCLVSCIGHIAAEAIGGCCLCLYTMLMTVFIIIEAALVGDMVFNNHWDKDLPYDPTGELERLQSFIEDNVELCRWVGLAVVIIQALSLLLAMILRAIVTTRRESYVSDDDSAVIGGGSKQPLLNSQGSQNFASTSMDNKGNHSDTWITRMREKYGLTSLSV